MKVLTSVIIGVCIIVVCVFIMLVVTEKVGANVKYCCDRINETGICLDEKCKDVCVNSTMPICNATVALG